MAKLKEDVASVLNEVPVVLTLVKSLNLLLSVHRAVTLLYEQQLVLGHVFI